MQSSPFLRIGTRGSALALVQARLVQRLLAEAHGVDPERIEIHAISTSGDTLKDAPLGEVGGKGLFSKEIEAALDANEVDIGVHSSKDMATTLPGGLRLAAFLEREDIRDAFVSLRAKSVDELPRGAKLGSSSLRRAAQMLRARPDLQIVPFRGNVDTRLRKLADGVADATLLAVAGLNRLGRQAEITSYLDPDRFPPAPAQGAIGLEIRETDQRTADLIAPLNHAPTTTAWHQAVPKRKRSPFRRQASTDFSTPWSRPNAKTRLQSGMRRRMRRNWLMVRAEDGAVRQESPVLASGYSHFTA